MLSGPMGKAGFDTGKLWVTIRLGETLVIISWTVG
jgi:hypothetical protein